MPLLGSDMTGERGMPETQASISVGQTLDAGSEYLKLELLAGESGLDNEITVQRIQKPGLAMAGYVDFIHPGRVQVLGASELSYLSVLPEAERVAVLTMLCECPITCIAITKSLEPPAPLAALCEAGGIPLLRSSLLSSAFIDRLNHLLDAYLAPKTTVHGVLVDVFGVGVLIVGPSGIGKSECALDLIVGGHRLVSDDAVEIRRMQGEILIGRGPELIQHHMEIRGLGIINVGVLFGAASCRQRKRIELVVELEAWQDKLAYDRLGLDQENYEILGVSVGRVRLPVASGRNVSILVEIAARSLLLKLKGFHPAAEFQERMQKAMEQPKFSLGAFDAGESDLE